jgi:hypothetical protein
MLYPHMNLQCFQVHASNSENVQVLKNDVDSYVVERWSRA